MAMPDSGDNRITVQMCPDFTESDHYQSELIAALTDPPIWVSVGEVGRHTLNYDTVNSAAEVK